MLASEISLAIIEYFLKIVIVISVFLFHGPSEGKRHFCGREYNILLRVHIEHVVTRIVSGSRIMVL